MFDIILVALLQTAAGDPASPAQNAPQTQEAPATAPSQPQAEQQTANADDVVHCRRERLSGSRVMQRVCTTTRQDAEMRSDARQMINRAQSQGRAD